MGLGYNFSPKPKPKPKRLLFHALTLRFTNALTRTHTLTYLLTHTQRAHTQKCRRCRLEEKPFYGVVSVTEAFELVEDFGLLMVTNIRIVATNAVQKPNVK